MKREAAVDANGTDRGPASLSFYALCKQLGKPRGYVRTLQQRLELPVAVNGEGYSAAYLSFLRTVVALRTLSVSLDDIRELLEMEKALLRLLKMDSLSASQTWYLDTCAFPCASRNRLMLTNFDIGEVVTPQGVQYHLDFHGDRRELFSDVEMGADAQRVMARYNGLRAKIVEQARAEQRILEDALAWSDEVVRGA